MRAFELNAVDYLLKPIRAERLLAALKKPNRRRRQPRTPWPEAADSKRRHFSIHERGKIVLVPLDEVIYLRAEQKYITVRTMQREFLMEDSLTRIEEEFGDAFVRIHRNTLVARPLSPVLSGRAAAGRRRRCALGGTAARPWGETPGVAAAAAHRAGVLSRSAGSR